MSGRPSDDIVAAMIDILTAYEGGGAMFALQGQAMDGYAALAEFLALARRARQEANSVDGAERGELRSAK